MEPSSGYFDKSKIFDVKPLRSLPPISSFPPFGSTQDAAATPGHPFGFPSQNPYGQTGFFPDNNFPMHAPLRSAQPLFSKQPGNSKLGKKAKNHVGGMQSTPESLNRVDSVRSGSEEHGGYSNDWRWNAQNPSSGNMQLVDLEATEKKKRKSNPSRRIRNNKDNQASQDGDSATVANLLMKYDALKRRFAQMEEAKEGNSKRPDLKAGALMMDYGLRTNMKRRIGAVPGVEIGDIFFFRIEMCLVGMHAPSMAGIDYMTVKIEQEEEPLAVSIVSSGGYEDDVEDGNVLIYSGQGGNNKRDGQAADQKLERGNLALETSLHHGNEVRVIRGVKDISNPTGKVYLYDGLYTIQESWSEVGKSGCNVFKYKLVRVPQQTEAFTIWKEIQLWRDNITSRPGIILPDLTSGAEKLPVPLVNDIDSDRGPSHFTYFPGLKYSKLDNAKKPSNGCNCHGACLSSHICSCVQKNGGDAPYTANGILVVQKPLIQECGPSCACYSKCRNIVSQNGMKVHLEVFKTKNRGWGLRSWDPIRPGTFICEYAGEIIEELKGQKQGNEAVEDEYIFDTTHMIDYSSEWNYTPELIGEDKPKDLNEACKSPLSMIVTAKNVGNVARFMNHSCSPNVFWQLVVREHNEDSYPHIVFYAMKSIPPLTELTYDYGARGRRKNCLCGSHHCKSYFG